MTPEYIKTWSNELVEAVKHAHAAHAYHANTDSDAVRFHDRATPYLVHPLWCAATLLQEPQLSLKLRRIGSLALLWHDTLEDTSLSLPSNVPEEVIQLVRGMTFTSFEDERKNLWERPLEVRLLKLYDKVSNLLDGSWMKQEKWNSYVFHTLSLAKDVEQSYGALNVVGIARAIAVIKMSESS